MLLVMSIFNIPFKIIISANNPTDIIIAAYNNLFAST